MALVVFHFAVPFLVLLHRAIKRNAPMVSRVAALILVMRFFDLSWLSAPAFAHGGELHVHWLDVALPMSLAAIWLGYSSINCAAARCCRCMTRSSARR